MGAARDPGSRPNGHQMEHHNRRSGCARRSLTCEVTVAESCQVAPLGRNLTYGRHHAAGMAVFLPRNQSGFMSNTQRGRGTGRAPVPRFRSAAWPISVGLALPVKSSGSFGVRPMAPARPLSIAPITLRLKLVAAEIVLDRAMNFG